MSVQPPPPGPTPASPPDGHPQGAPPPPPPQSAESRWQPPAATSAAKPLPTALLLQVAALILTIVSLTLSTDGQKSWYSDTTAWAVFATIAAVLQLAPSLAKTTGWSTEASWTIGAIGAGGLFAWWVLIALPAVSSNQGFTATMAVAAAVIGSWLSPGRRL